MIHLFLIDFLLVGILVSRGSFTKVFVELEEKATSTRRSVEDGGNVRDELTS